MSIKEEFHGDRTFAIDSDEFCKITIEFDEADRVRSPTALVTRGEFRIRITGLEAIRDVANALRRCLK